MQHLALTVDRGCVTAPRDLREDQIVKVTCRCVNRTYRLVPTPKVVEMVLFCLAHVSAKYRLEGKIELYAFCFMSTHYHLTLRDVGGCVSKFLQELNSLLSRNLNAMRGSRGTNFEPDPGIQTILGAERVLKSVAYDEANPAVAGIVSTSEAWKGVTSAHMVLGEEKEVARPKFGIWSTKRAHARREGSRRSGRAAYARTSKVPTSAVLKLDRPPFYPELGDDELHARMKAMREHEERKAAGERKGRRVLGMRKARAVHWNTLPTEGEEMFTCRPTFAAEDPVTRKMLAQLRRAFLRAYREALRAFKAGVRDVVFPEGTVLMKHRFGVAVAAYGFE